MKDKKIYLGVGLALLLLMTISLSYAYFSASVSGNDNAKDVIVNAGSFLFVAKNGYWGYNTALASYGVSPAFRIG
mgnify:FL=1